MTQQGEWKRVCEKCNARDRTWSGRKCKMCNGTGEI